MDRGANVHPTFGRLKIDSAPRSSHLTASAFSTPNDSPIGHSAPIAMQIPTPRLELDHLHDSCENSALNGLNDDHPNSSYKLTGSFMEQANRQRKNSVTFDPNVKLESGRQLPLQSPLPRAIKLDGSAKKQYFQQKVPIRSYTWSEQNSAQSNQADGSQGYRNSVFGYGGGGSIRERRTQRLRSQMGSPDSEGVSSLTSDSTISMSDEFRTPPPTIDPFGLFFPSPITNSPLNEDSHDNSSWFSPRKMSSSVRNKSFSSLDGRTRSRSRRSFSDRSASPGSSSQLSPANLFLTGFNTASSQPLEPDSEGQEVGSYVLGKQVGFGGFSVVKEAITIEGDCEIKRAVKIVRKRARDVDCENDQVQAEFDHEVSLWRCLNHPNILPLIAVYDTPFATFAFMRLNQGGSLYDLIKLNRQGLSAPLATKYALQLACALRYLHEDMRIIHRDVKLENCLVDMSVDVDEGGNLQLCDFGMAEFMKNTLEEDDDDSDSSGNAFTLDPRPGRRSRRKSSSASSMTPVITSTPAGSLEYAAPEMVADKSPMQHFTCAVDMWAFGVVVYALFTGTLPFSHTFQPKLQNMILRGEWNEELLKGSRGLAEAGREDSKKVLDVVRGCLTIEVDERWDIRAVLESPWLEEFGGESP